jgi:type VI secretion system protein VasI
MQKMFAMTGRRGMSRVAGLAVALGIAAGLSVPRVVAQTSSGANTVAPAEADQASENSSSEDQVSGGPSSGTPDAADSDGDPRMRPPRARADGGQRTRDGDEARSQPSDTRPDTAGGFRLDTTAESVRRRAEEYAVADLTVGDSGLINSSSDMCWRDGQLFVVPTVTLRDKSAYGTYLELMRKPGRRVDAWIRIGDELSDRREQKKNLLLRLISLPACRLYTEFGQIRPDSLIAVDRIDGRGSVSGLMERYLSQGNTSDGNPGSGPAGAAPEDSSGDDASGHGASGDGGQSAEDIIQQVQDQLDQNWIVRKDKSPIDDSPRVVIMNRADRTEGMSGWRDRPRMVLRCQRNETNLYVIVGDYLGSDGRKSVTYRFGEEAAQKASWSVSTDNDAVGLWSGGQAIPFMKRLLAVDRFVFNITPYNSAPVTAVFKTAGLRDKLAELAAACNWSIERKQQGSETGQSDDGTDTADSPESGEGEASEDAERSADVKSRPDQVVERWLSRAEIREVQRALARRGYYDGAIDGLIGPNTRSAVRSAQRTEWAERAVDVDGRIDRQLLEKLDVLDVRVPDASATETAESN